MISIAPPMIVRYHFIFHRTEEAFDKKLFTVDVFDLLINDELEFSEVIHAGCWKAVAENLKLKLEHTTNTEQDI